MEEITTNKLDIAAVTKTVAETDRRRALVEEKLNQAQSLVEALNAESISLQESVLDLKRDLEETARAKDAETAALGRAIEERRRAIEDLKVLSVAADELRAASERKSSAIGANLDAARNELAALESSVSKARSDAGSLDEMVGKLRETVAQARRQAEALDSQLTTVGKATRSAVDGAADIQRRIDEARTSLDSAAARKEETDETCAALASITAALRHKTSDAVLAVKTMDDMMTEHARQSSDIAKRLADVADLVGKDEKAGTNGAGGNGVSNGRHLGKPQPGVAQFGDALRSIALLALERQISHEEAADISSALEAGDGERALRAAWALTTGGPMPAAHRLVFGEVLRAMGDVKAAIVYFEQAASAKNSPAVVRYLAALAYLKMDLLDRCAYVAQLLGRDRAGKLLARVIEALRSEQTGNADYAVHSLAEAAAMRGFPKWEYDEAYFQLGGLHERRQDTDAAIAAYEKVNGSSAPYQHVVDRVRGLF